MKTRIRVLRLWTSKPTIFTVWPLTENLLIPNLSIIVCFWNLYKWCHIKEDFCNYPFIIQHCFWKLLKLTSINIIYPVKLLHSWNTTAKCHNLLYNALTERHVGCVHFVLIKNNWNRYHHPHLLVHMCKTSSDVCARSSTVDYKVRTSSALLKIAKFLFRIALLITFPPAICDYSHFPLIIFV